MNYLENLKFGTGRLGAVCRCCLDGLEAQRIAINDRIDNLIVILTNDVSSVVKVLITFYKVSN